MIIGIDVDGVLVDMELYQIKYGTRYFQKKYNKEIVNPKGYDDKIFFCAERDSSTDKFDVCIREKVDVLVDDKPENLLALKNKIQVICYPAAWNEDRKELNEYRINKFEEISGKIQRD